MRLEVTSLLCPLMRLVVVSIVGLLAACEAQPEQQRQEVGTAFCKCETSTPFALEQCLEEVLPFVDATPTEECMDCVYLNSQMCSTLFDDCVDLCVQQPQP